MRMEAARLRVHWLMLASGKTTNGGAVLSVDAMSFIGALPIDNYNGAARSSNVHKVMRFKSIFEVDSIILLIHPKGVS